MEDNNSLEPVAPVEESDVDSEAASQGEPKEVRGATMLTMTDLDLVGVTRRVSSKRQTNFADVEAFIDEKLADGTLDALKALSVLDEAGQVKLYGVSLNFDKEEYDYFLGVESKETPKTTSGLETITVQESLYARFDVHGAAPQSVKECWKDIYNNWFGAVPYNHSGAPELEEWTLGSARGDENAELKVYVPVKRIIRKSLEKRPSILGYVVGGGLGVLVGSVLGSASGDTRMGVIIGLVAGLVLGGVAKKILEGKFKK